MKQLTPTLETDQLFLRPMHLTDAPAIFVYASNPQVTQFTHWGQHRSVQETQTHIATTYKKNLIWGIEHKETKTIIGECGFAHVNYPSAELYYALGQPWWGKGLAAQAVEELITYSFKEMGIKRLNAWIMQDNIRSVRVAQKVGMTCEAVYPQQWYANDTLHDVHVYSKHA